MATERNQIERVGDTIDDLVPVVNAPTLPIGGTVHGDVADLTVEGAGFSDAPVNTIAPSISGDAVEDETLSVDIGLWVSQQRIVSYSYQWVRDGANIGSATGATYDLVTADVDAIIACDVTATDVAGNTTTVRTAGVGPVVGAA